MSTAVPTKAKPRVTQVRMSEDDLLTAVLELAKLPGWRCYHQRPNRLGQIVQGDRGFPDLVLVRPRRLGTGVAETEQFYAPTIRFVELKSDRGVVSPEQQRWLDALGPYACVWRPSDLRDGTIERALR